MIPDSAEDVELGVPIERNNLKKGWVRLEILEQEITDNKGSKRTIGGKKSILNLSPKGADLKDGHALAFRFRKHSTSHVDEDSDMEIDIDDPGWDVQIAAYDDEE